MLSVFFQFKQVVCLLRVIYSLKWVPATYPKAKYSGSIVEVSFIPPTHTNRFTTRYSNGCYNHRHSFIQGVIKLFHWRKKKTSLFKNLIGIAFVTCDRFALFSLFFSLSASIGTLALFMLLYIIGLWVDEATTCSQI